MAPTPRTTNARATTLPAIPRAALADEVTCAAAAATEVNTRPTPARDAPWMSEACASNPAERKTNVSSTPTRADATTATSTEAAVAAWRPVTVARSSSARPDSSSARVCRTTRNITISATRRVAVLVVSYAVMPPSVFTSYGMPFIILPAPLELTVTP